MGRMRVYVIWAVGLFRSVWSVAGDEWASVKPGYVDAPVPKKSVKYPFSTPQRLLQSPGIESSEVIAGSLVGFSYRFEGEPPAFPFRGEMAISKDGVVCWREPLKFTPEENIVGIGDGKWQLSFEMAFPLYFDTGRYEFGLTVSGFCGNSKDGSLPYPSGAVKLRRIATDPKFERTIECKVRELNGAPEFFVNGKATYPLWGVVNLRANPDGRHSDMPLNFLTIWSDSWTWHPETNRFRGVELDRLAEIHRRAHPDAYFVWDLTVYPPPDWKRAHPEELVADENGERKPFYRTDFSFASRKAMDVMRGEVEEAIRYLENSPYANRIVAYRISSGETPEWLAYSPSQGRAYDFSRPSLDAYRTWAARHYPDLENVTPSLHADRMSLDNGKDLLWDQKRHLDSIAFWEFYSDTVADDCIELNLAAKRVLQGKKPVGTYHGYTFYLGALGTWQGRALFAYKKVLDSGAVDFVCSPHGYAMREPGNHFADMKPFGTNRLRGIVNANENDARTHNSPLLAQRYGQTVCEEHTVMCLRRDMATELCRRNPYYYYPIAAGSSVKFPRMAEEGRIFRALGQHLLDTGAPRRKAEVALVASERSCTSLPIYWRFVSSGEKVQYFDTNGVVRTGLRAPRNILTGETFIYGLDRWARAGTPIDYLLAEDIADYPGDYKLYVFLNEFKYDEQTRQAVERLRERGATILWLYAPGWAKGADSGISYMKELTGIDFEKLATDEVAGVTMIDDGRFMGLPEELVTPLFTPKSPCETLGTYPCGKVGAAKFQIGNSKTYFSGAWQLDQKFIRSVIRDSGAFVYCEKDDAIEANEKLFMLHAASAGVKHVRLPRRTDVVDVFGMRIIARGVTEFDFYASLHSTHLFYLSDDGNVLLGKLSK